MKKILRNIFLAIPLALLVVIFLLVFVIAWIVSQVLRLFPVPVSSEVDWYIDELLKVSGFRKSPIQKDDLENDKNV